MDSSFVRGFAALTLSLLAWIPSAHADAYSDFWEAMRRDNGRALSALLAKGMDPNTVANNGDPALVAALRERSKEVTKVLLEAPGLKPDLASPSGETALMLAALHGNEAAVRQLLDRGAQLKRAGWTALHYAASGGDVGITQLLISKGAVVDARTTAGVTPLMMAARENQTEVVDALLAAKAKLDLCTDRGLSAADFARNAGHERLAKKLAIPDCA